MLGAAPGQPPHRYPAPPAYGGTDIDVHTVDPERLAGVPSRLGAVLIDGLLPLLVYLPSAAFGASVAWNGMEPTPGVLSTLGLIAVLTYVAMMGYMAYALVQLGQGRSPGKKLLGLRVIYLETGRPAGFWRMVLREVIGKWVSAVVLYLGFFWAIWDEKHQGWHDKIAKTVVVQEDTAGQTVREAPYRAGF